MAGRERVSSVTSFIVCFSFYSADQTGNWEVKVEKRIISTKLLPTGYYEEEDLLDTVRKVVCCANLSDWVYMYFDCESDCVYFVWSNFQKNDINIM